MYVDYFVAFMFGALVGVSELVARYKDEPTDAVKTFSAVLYITINALVSSAALFIARVFGWTFGSSAAGDDLKLRVLQVLVTGFASMAVLRSSFFTVKLGNQDVGIGFNVVVQSLLRAVDNAVDRTRGASRNESVAFMDAVSFEKASIILPAYCLQLMQNLPSGEQEALARNLEAIKKLKADNCVKSRMLGVAIINVMGLKVLTSAVTSLGDEIKLK